MGTPTDWRLDEIERNAREGAGAARRLYELDTLRSNVDSLERTNRELYSCIDGLRSAAESGLSRIEALERMVEELMSNVD